MAKRVTGKKPETMITDGLKSYHIAYKKEFWTRNNPRQNTSDTSKYEAT